MKNITLTTIAFLAMSTYVMAGGDIVPVEEPVVEVQEVVVSDAGFYVGVAYTALTNETTISNGVNGEADYDGFMLQAGYKFNPYIAVEARYWNVGDERLNMSHPVGHPDGDDHSVESAFDAWGVYLKPIYPITEALDVYALLGWGTQNTVNHTYTPDDSGLSWGAGVAYSFTDNISIFVDYVGIYDDTAIENSIDPFGNEVDVEVQSTTLNIGITYKF